MKVYFNRVNINLFSSSFFLFYITLFVCVSHDGKKYHNFQHMQMVTYLLLQGLMTTTAIILIVFIFCFYGNNVTADCELIAMSAYETRWYIYPMRMRKYMIHIIMRSQQPFYFTGFKFTICSLNTFTKVST